MEGVLVVEKGFGEFSAVERKAGFAGQDGDAALEVLFAERLDGAHGSTTPSDNEYLLWALCRALDVWLSSARLDRALIPLDVDRSTLLNYLEFGERIKRRGILDVSRSNVEAG